MQCAFRCAFALIMISDDWKFKSHLLKCVSAVGDRDNKGEKHIYSR